ncbi:MAG: hypothetical protein IJV32_02510 [Bacteroidales bacterium]|nr:hypothetical protein [Bacteroidales bacterium]
MRPLVTAFLIVLSSLQLSAARKEPVKVSCVGDSITYGMKLENREQDAYPFQLQRMLGDGYLVGNFGKSGATLLRHGHRPYFDQDEFRQALEFAGDIVVIHLGINDTDPRNWPHYSREFVDDYLALMDSLKSRNPKARFIVAKMTPIGHTHTRFLTGTKQYHGEIQEAIREVVKRSGAQYIDFYEPLYHYPWMLPDAVHPTAEGATFLAKEVYSAITGDFGGLQMPQWYSDGMVLPRDKVFSIRGTANAGEKVQLKISGKKYTAVTGKDGRWEIKAGPFPATLSTELEIKAAKRKLVFKDVALGDIWLCSGQSNMEFELRQSSTAGDAQKARDNGLRLYDMKCNWRTDNVTWRPSAVDSVQHLQYFRPTAWAKATPETAARFSAIGYYFGKTVRDSLRVPVGLVCNAVGGSTAESWVDRELLETRYPAILYNWMKNRDIMEWARGRARKNLGGEGRHPYEPCYLYESALLPLKDMPVTGVLWYQGESNAENIPVHEILFPLVVDSFRGLFGEVPFYYCQLSEMNRPTWPDFRKSQEKLQNCRPRLGMVVTKDLGEWTEVHYRNKKPAGERLAALALNNCYGRESFGDHFEDGTLRLDYVFCGNNRKQEVYLRQAFRTSAWAGRRTNLQEPLLRGNGQIRVLDQVTGACLYANSFSSLFQEWTATEEATKVQKAFENSFQVPWPKHPVNVELTLRDTHGNVSAGICHPVDPEDILIRLLKEDSAKARTVHGGGALPESIDIVIVSEGYTETEQGKFFKDASRAADALFSHEPFKSREGQFTVRAVFAPSKDSGVSVPHDKKWLSTAVSGSFDTFYSQRYLTTQDIWHLWDLIGTVPFEHVIVLANTPVYGGGGIYNNITIMNSDHPTFVPVLVHEFGHSFGGLADEYYYDDQYDTQYPSDTEPWEPNITTLVNFQAKWADMMASGKDVGLHEGGGYMSKGVFRPNEDCRMKTNECDRFCPVCYRAIEAMIDYYTTKNQ